LCHRQMLQPQGERDAREEQGTPNLTDDHYLFTIPAIEECACGQTEYQ
jgi:hypothetical protein